MMAGLIHGIIHEDSWDLYTTSEDSTFIFETEECDTKVDRFVLLKKTLMDIRPEIAVDVQDKEKLLESLTMFRLSLARWRRPRMKSRKSNLAPTMRAGSSLSSSEHSKLLPMMISSDR